MGGTSPTITIFGAATINSGIAGTAGLVKSGTGSLTLSGSNSYRGASTVNAGTLTYSGAATSSGGGNLNVATAAGNIAVVNFSSSGTLTVGEAPVGVATFTGGTATVASGFRFLIGDSDGTGVLNLGTESGGTAVLTSQNSGGVQVTDGNHSAGSGTLNLNSGVLNQTAGSINKAGAAGATAVVNFNGGTLRAGANNLTLINNTLDSVNVYNGGARFDTNGFTATVAANLRGTAGNGIYPAGGMLNIASGGGTGYIGAPYVQVTGGSGNGAMAIADVSGGVVTGVTLTNPGQNYQAGDTLTFLFSGGGAAAAAGPFQYTLTAGDVATNTSGGLTKVGAGTLVVTGTNTYQGGTNVENGVLQLGSSGALPAGTAVTMGAGSTSGTLDLSGFSPTVGGLATAGTGTANVIGNSSTSTNSTLTFAGTGPISTFGGTIQDTVGSGTMTVALVVSSGKLALTNANTYTRGTAVNGGTLQVSADNNLGAAAGGLSFDSGTLAVTGSGFASARATTLNAGGGIFDIAPAATLTMSGVIGGTGSLTKTDAGTLILPGANSYAGGTMISAGTLQLGNGGASGSIVGDVTNNGILAFKRSDTLAFGGAISGSGALVQMGSGTTVLTGASTYGGPTTVQSGSLIVNGSIVSPVTVLPAGTLAGSGIVGSVVNQGVVWPGNPVVGDTGYGALTVRGNYSDPEGQVIFNTFLGSDGSPSSRLILDGGTTNGTSTVVVHPTGLNGALTQNNGIQLVQAVNGATTGAQAFVMPAELRAGAFNYRLFQGGINGSAPNDWFLRSHFAVASVEPSVIPPPTALPVDPPPATLDPGRYPIIGPELATYGVAQPLARQLGLTTLGTLHERIGNTLGEPHEGSGSAGWTRSGWGRVFGQQIDNRYQAFTAPGTSGSLLGFQAGLDLWRGSSRPGHHDAAGVYFAYGNSSVSVDGLVTNAAATAYERGHTGSVSLDGYTGGAYWTHYGPGGWYVDAVFQGTSYNGHASTQFARLPVSGSGLATSLEGGYPLPLAFGPGFVLEPQVQLIWQHVGLNESSDGLGSVDLSATSGGTGRIGVRGQWTIERGNGQVWQPYVRTNLWRDWGAQATTTFSGVNQVPLAQQATRMDVAVGFTAKLAASMSCFGQFGYQFAVNSSESGQRKGVWGDIGIRYAW